MHLQIALYLLIILPLVHGSIIRNHLPFFKQKNVKLGLQHSQQAERESSQIQDAEAPILPKYITKTTIITRDVQEGTTNGLVTTTIRRKIHVEINEQPMDVKLDKRLAADLTPTSSDPLGSTSTIDPASISTVTLTATYDFYLGYDSLSSYYTLQTDPVNAPTFTLADGGLLSQFDSVNTISGYMGDPTSGYFGIPTDVANNHGVAAPGAYPLNDAANGIANYYETSMMTDGIQTGGGSSLTWRNPDFQIQNNQVVWCTVDGNNILLAQVDANPSVACTPVNVYLATCK